VWSQAVVQDLTHPDILALEPRGASRPETDAVVGAARRRLFSRADLNYFVRRNETTHAPPPDLPTGVRALDLCHRPRAHVRAGIGRAIEVLPPRVQRRDDLRRGALGVDDCGQRVRGQAAGRDLQRRPNEVEVEPKRRRTQDRAELAAAARLLREATGWKPTRSLKER
jgi:hypothetical protein